MPPAKAAKMIREIAEAIHHAHERGVVHRDLKTADILLTWPTSPASPTWAWPDTSTSGRHYGRAASARGPRATCPPTASGNTDLIGPATDIYAIGAILYDGAGGPPAVQGRATY